MQGQVFPLSLVSYKRNSLPGVLKEGSKRDACRYIVFTRSKTASQESARISIGLETCMRSIHYGKYCFQLFFFTFRLFPAKNGTYLIFCQVQHMPMYIQNVMNQSNLLVP